MADDLDLSALASGPAPVLASADLVRARGDQRTRRTRAVLAGSAALVVLAGAGTAVALADRGKPSSLQITTTPSPVPSPAYAGAYLPTPQDAARAAGGSWDPGIVVDDQGLLLYVCPLGEGFTAPGVSRFLERGNAGAHTFVSVLSAGEPQRWVQTFRQAVERCPRRAADSADGKASNSFDLLDPTTLDSAVIRDTYRDCDTCPSSVTLWIVAAGDRVLSVTSLTGASETQLEAWREVIDQRLRSPIPNPPTPTSRPSATG